MARKPTDIVPLMLRLREDLRRRLDNDARRNHRSLNAEVLARLEASYAKENLGKVIKQTADTVARSAHVKLAALIEETTLRLEEGLSQWRLQDEKWEQLNQWYREQRHKLVQQMKRDESEGDQSEQTQKAEPSNRKPSEEG